MQISEGAMLIDRTEKQVLLESVEDRDLPLVRRFLAGEERAFDELVGRHQSFVYHTCLHMLGNPSDAEDAAQDVFVAVYKALPRFGKRSKVSTWIYRITVNQCISRRRRPCPETQAEIEPAEQGERIEEIEKRRNVRRLLQRLAPHYRAVLVLKYYRELSYDETAQVLGWSPEKVKCYLHRARNLFKRFYEEDSADEVLQGS